MKFYTVKLFWTEPDGSPNMMITAVEAVDILDAISDAIDQCAVLLKPNGTTICKIDAQLDELKLLARSSSLPLASKQ